MPEPTPLPQPPTEMQFTDLNGEPKSPADFSPGEAIVLTDTFADGKTAKSVFINEKDGDTRVTKEIGVQDANDLVLEQVRTSLEVVASKESSPTVQAYIEHASAIAREIIRFSQGGEESLEPSAFLDTMRKLDETWKSTLASKFGGVENPSTKD